MAREIIDYGIEKSIVADHGRVWWQAELLERNLQIYRTAPLDVFPEDVTVTERTREENYSMPHSGPNTIVKFRNIEFQITPEEMQSAPPPIQRLFKKTGIKVDDEVSVVLTLDHETGRFSCGIEPKEINERRIGAAFRSTSGLEVKAPFEKYWGREQTFEIQIHDAYDLETTSKITIVDQFLKSYGGSGNKEGYMWRAATLLVGTKWARKLLDSRLKEPLEEPTISPVELIEKLRKDERRVEIGYPRKNRKPVYFGYLDGEAYYHLLFEISTIPRVELAARMQSIYHSLPREEVLVAAMTFKMPEELKSLSETLSVCGGKTRQDLLMKIEGMDEEDRTALLVSLMQFDKEMEDQLKRNVKPGADFAFDDHLRGLDQELIDSLVSANRRKWNAIWKYKDN